MGFLRHMQVTEMKSGNSDGLHSQALSRCVTSPHLYVHPCRVYISGSAGKGSHVKCKTKTDRSYRGKILQ